MSRTFRKKRTRSLGMRATSQQQSSLSNKLSPKQSLRLGIKCAHIGTINVHSSIFTDTIPFGTSSSPDQWRSLFSESAINLPTSCQSCLSLKSFLIPGYPSLSPHWHWYHYDHPYPRCARDLLGAREWCHIARQLAGWRKVKQVTEKKGGWGDFLLKSGWIDQAFQGKAYEVQEDSFDRNVSKSEVQLCSSSENFPL